MVNVDFKATSTYFKTVINLGSSRRPHKCYWGPHLVCGPTVWHMWSREKQTQEAVLVFFSFCFSFRQRAPVCASSVAVQLGPVPCRALTVRGVRFFNSKSPSGSTPAASGAAWWRWEHIHLQTISLALYIRGTTIWIMFLAWSLNDLIMSPT